MFFVDDGSKILVFHRPAVDNILRENPPPERGNNGMAANVDVYQVLRV